MKASPSSSDKKKDTLSSLPILFKSELLFRKSTTTHPLSVNSCEEKVEAVSSQVSCIGHSITSSSLQIHNVESSEFLIKKTPENENCTPLKRSQSSFKLQCRELTPTDTHCTLKTKDGSREKNELSRIFHKPDFAYDVKPCPLKSEASCLRSAGSTLLEQPRGDGFTSLTQNVLKHVLDLQNLARNAASSLFTSSRQQLQAIHGQSIISMDNECSDDVNQIKQECILTSSILNGLPRSSFEINCNWNIIKYPCCWNVHALRRRSDHVYEYRCLLSERLISRPMKPLALLHSTRFDLQEQVCLKESEIFKSFRLYLHESIVYKTENAVYLMESSQPILGIFILTNYRVVFLPDIQKNDKAVTSKIQWMHLVNFWEVPNAIIQKCTPDNFSLKTGSLIMQALSLSGNHHSRGNTLILPAREQDQGKTSLDTLCIEIITKDMRSMRFVFRETMYNETIWLTLFKTLFPSSFRELFALSFICESTEETNALTDNVTKSIGLFPKPLAHFFSYNPEREWGRFLEHSHCSWLRLSTVNQHFSVCSTYPRLVVVPKLITDVMLYKIALFRSKQRFPCLCWASSYNKATLWRCSQPKSMFQRCPEDELFFELILSSYCSRDDIPHVLILDARPLVNAFANKASGAGFENTSTYYKGCQILFASIDNIHSLREAWKKLKKAVNFLSTNAVSLPSLRNLNGAESTHVALDVSSHNLLKHCPTCSMDLSETLSLNLVLCDSFHIFYMKSSSSLCTTSCCDVPEGSYSSFLQKLSQSGWYDYIQRLIRASNVVLSRLHHGGPVVIHCSDGWDRTVQLTSLVMLCIDAFYRTMEGFFILIEQEFLHGGHQFHTRCDHPGKITYEDYLHILDVSEADGISESLKKQLHLSKKKQAPSQWKPEGAPVFLQWLDCVYQVMTQYKSCFEFTTTLLDVLAVEVYSCFFGTFLGDNACERNLTQISCRSLCLWNHILNDKHRFLQRSYIRQDSTSPLIPNAHDIKFWYSYWFRHRPAGLDYLVQTAFQHCT